MRDWIFEWGETPILAWPLKAFVTVVFIAYWIFAFTYQRVVGLGFDIYYRIKR